MTDLDDLAALPTVSDTVQPGDLGVAAHSRGLAKLTAKVKSLLTTPAGRNALFATQEARDTIDAVVPSSVGRGGSARPALDEAYLRRARPGWLIGMKNAAPVYGTQVMAVNMTSRRVMALSGALAPVQVEFTHFATGSTGDGLPPGAVKFRAGIEVSGYIFPLTFNGATLVTLELGSVLSDPVLLPAGLTSLPVRTFVYSDSPTTPRANWYAIGSNGEGREAGDHVVSGTAASADVIDNFNTYIWGPSAAIMSPVAGAEYRAFGIVGGSIHYGQGDSPVSDGIGHMMRAAERDAVPALMCARPGERVGQLDANYQWRGTLLSRCTHVAGDHGRNDLTDGANLSTIQNALIKLWRRIAASGPLMYATTVTPRTTSTDSWATVANQVVANAGEEAVRVSLNTWLRDGAPLNPSTFAAVAVGAAGVRAGAAGHPLRAVWEMTDTVETARNSGIWKAGLTADGLHPNGAGYTALTAVVPNLATLPLA